MSKTSSKIYRFKVVSSTNTEAIQRAEIGEPEGAIFVADSQTAGRGRSGNRWESPPGKNIYVSFLLRPEVKPADSVPITRIAAFAVLEALQSFLPAPELSIKWPNDILLKGKKVAGILSEMGSEGGKTRWVVCGIGLNINADLEDFSPPLRETATSLKIGLGHELDREEVLQKIIAAMDKWYGRFQRGEFIDVARP